jgi:hypothetical protein
MPARKRINTLFYMRHTGTERERNRERELERELQSASEFKVRVVSEWGRESGGKEFAS